MFQLNLQLLKDRCAQLEAVGWTLPSFNIEEMRKATKDAPRWVHFGTGNLFKAYHAMLAQTLLEKGDAKTGIIAVVPNDKSSIDEVFTPHDNLWVCVVMKADGTLKKTICASMAVVIAADPFDGAHWGRLSSGFCAPSLQLATLAVTEKAYNLTGIDGAFLPEVLADFEAGHERPSHLMLKITSLLFLRFKVGGAPLALVSTDNFSHNGDRLKSAILSAAAEWQKRGFVDADFTAWLSGGKVTFPLSMIDKITPYPSQRVSDALSAAGLSGMEIRKTARGSVNAAFVNTEEAEYLVIEDAFPNGRPPLEKAGVYFTDRETVDKVERMKVSTCLNPLHTALAISGCLLGYTSIAAEMADADLAALAAKIGRNEGLPVVTNPGIIAPAAFLDEVLTRRLPNPAIPDTPQRIAQDTSQKLAPRFGETIKLYMTSGGEVSPLGKAPVGSFPTPLSGGKPPATPPSASLTLIPLVIALWCRYLLGIDDKGAPFTPSPDPLLEDLTKQLSGITLGAPETARGKLVNILSNEKIFGVNLYEAGLGEKIESFFEELLEGRGAVRAAIHKYAG